jgi:hypothetical protein
MVDFQKAFLKGIEAHDEATRARKEISSVFDEFARQVNAASGGKVQIRRDASQRADKARRAPTPTPSASSGGIDVPALPTPPGHEAVTFGTLYAGAPYGERYELGSYQLSRLGYPVVMTFSGNDYRCEDKPSLEECLAELLQDPITGGKLRRLMGSDGVGSDVPPPADEAPSGSPS